MDIESGRRGWVPKEQWASNLSKEELVKRFLAKGNRKKRRGSSKKGRPSKRARYSSRRYSGGAAGGSIIYPNVIGRGPYYAKGDVGFGNPDSWLRGNFSGGISDTVQGMGPYIVKRNSLLSAIDLGMDPPMVRNTNRGEAVIFNHREYLGDLNSGTGTPTEFQLQQYALNPGNVNLFPFLCSIACNFQEYEVRGMLVELKSLSSDYAAALSMGSVFMAADYNVYGNTPTTKQQIENMEYASSAKPSRSLIMPIECEAQNNGLVHKNVAIEGEYHGGDKRLYDWCNIYIGTQGIPSASTPIAEIWVTYEIALFKPILDGNRGHAPLSTWDAAHFVVSNRIFTPPGSAAITGAGGWSTSPGSSPDITLDQDLGEVIFPRIYPGDTTKRYLVVVNYTTNTNLLSGSFIGEPDVVDESGVIENFGFCSAGTNAASSFAMAGAIGEPENNIIGTYVLKVEPGVDPAGFLPRVHWSVTCAVGIDMTGRTDIYVTTLPATFEPTVS